MFVYNASKTILEVSKFK